MKTKSNYKMPKIAFAILWIISFPMAIKFLQKTEKITPIQIFKHFLGFCTVWIIGIVVISKICDLF